MSKKVRKCCLCGEKLPAGEYGNSPEPLKSLALGVCCNKCNREKVIPTRFQQLKHPAGINPAVHAAKPSGTNYAIQARGDANE